MTERQPVRVRLARQAADLTHGDQGRGAQSSHGPGRPAPAVPMTALPHPLGDEQPVTEAQLGGDPACWLARVCPECGQFIEDAQVDPESHFLTPTK